MNEFKKNCYENNNRGKNPILFELGKEMNFKFQIFHQISWILFWNKWQLNWECSIVDRDMIHLRQIKRFNNV